MTRLADAVKQMGLDGEISLLGRWVRLQAERCSVYVIEGPGADEKGPTMERMCIACGGSGLAEHVDRTLPPPPCRLCHPEEAELHMALARETRSIVAARRLDAYQSLRAAIVRGDVVPPSGRRRSATPNVPSSHSMNAARTFDAVAQNCCSSSLDFSVRRRHNAWRSNSPSRTFLS